MMMQKNNLDTSYKRKRVADLRAYLDDDAKEQIKDTG